jgi:hypothetical protein
MITRIAFLERPPRFLLILWCVIYLFASAEAQHGGGGGHSGAGHSGGGHFGGGHSSSSWHSSIGHGAGRHSNVSQRGEHSGRWHFGFGKHSARNLGFGKANTSDISARGPSRLWTIPTAGGVPPTTSIRSTLLSSQLLPRHAGGQARFVSSFKYRHRGFYFDRYRRFPSSGCFLKGATQFCFFEPFLPLLSCYGGFSISNSGFDFGGELLDLGGDLNSQGPQWEMAAIQPAANPSDETAEASSPSHPAQVTGATTEGLHLGRGVFLLVLNNGSRGAVTDYWVSDGYLEFVSPDGTRSHIPLEALDLQRTVTENAPRGLAFVLRSTPAQLLPQF